MGNRRTDAITMVVRYGGGLKRIFRKPGMRQTTGTRSGLIRPKKKSNRGGDELTNGSGTSRPFKRRNERENDPPRKGEREDSSKKSSPEVRETSQVNHQVGCRYKPQ